MQQTVRIMSRPADAITPQPVPATDATAGLRFRMVAAAYAIWLLGVWLVFYLVHGRDENAQQLVVMGGAIPALLQLFLLGVDWRGLVAPTKIWLALLFVILLSYVVNAMDPRTAPTATNGTVIPPSWIPVVYTMNTAFITAIATLVAGSPDRRLLRAVASFYCVITAPYLLYVDLTGKMLWGRLAANDLEPNNWGLMGLTLCLAALARKLGPVAVASFAVGVYTILLASSREHLVALVGVLLVLVVLRLRTLSRSRLYTALVGSCVALGLAAVLLDPYILDALRYFNHDILLLDSPNRGVDSGFTGRTYIWSAAVDLWMKSPLLGVGFRQHEQFLGGLPAHNAYLAMLADTGVLGLIVYLVLQIGSLIASWRIEDERIRRFIMTSIVGYIIIGFFDRRTINSGNPYGLFFLMCCAFALADRSLRKASRLYQLKLGASAAGSSDQSRPALAEHRAF